MNDTNQRLSDKVAIVTGAGQGIGEAIAHRFAEEGASVVVADINEETGAETSRRINEAGGSAEFVETDVTETDQVDSMVTSAVDAYGSLDVFVNNAGGNISDDNMHRIDKSTWEANVELNLTGAFLCSRRALPVLARNGGGNMVHISSINALEGISLTAYSAAKGGIRSLSKLIATQYGCHGIRSNVIHPGTITTDPEDQFEPGEVLEEWIDQYPVGRLGRPEDIANAALYLASDEASFVTGSELVVDGGFTSGPDQSFQRLNTDIDEFPSIE